MGQVFAIDAYVGHEWYPGFGPAQADGPRAFEPLGVFSKADEGRLWALDFHIAQGLVPLAFAILDDAVLFGSQVVAERLPVPTGRGLTSRMVGPNVYSAEIPVTEPWEVERRRARAARSLPALIDAFPATWAADAEELDAWFHRLVDGPLDAERTALRAYLEEAMLFARRAWDVHWACMYPLLANYLGFLGLCRELGLDSQGVARLFQGYETQITATDRGLWQLAVAARGAGLEALFADTPAEHLRQAIQGTGTGARAWREDLERFLARHGWRTEGIYDVSLAPWTEDPTPALGTIKTLLATEVEHDFDAARDAAARERDALVADARARLTVEERAAFDAGLRAGRHANFAWWNEEHNVYIDLRTHIPLRRLALAVGQLVGAERPDDACFLFSAELRALLAGRRAWGSLAPLVAERRRFHADWEARRAAMPKLLGTMPDEVNDPVLREIFGVSPQFLAAMERRDDALDELSGLPASPGVARGRARVLLSAEELHAVEAGEVLVCEATSPNWTPAFTKIAACVCDAGGSLTHAAIVSREYRVPCVTGCAIATATIATGDLLEVDGSAGRVRILERAASGDEALVA